MPIFTYARARRSRDPNNKWEWEHREHHGQLPRNVSSGRIRSIKTVHGGLLWALERQLKRSNETTSQQIRALQRPPEIPGKDGGSPLPALGANQAATETQHGLRPTHPTPQRRSIGDAVRVRAQGGTLFQSRLWLGKAPDRIPPRPERVLGRIVRVSLQGLQRARRTLIRSCSRSWACRNRRPCPTTVHC